MGANTFYTEADGATAQEAFSKAVDDAAWENGHGGYTGTIAEKDSFTMIEIPATYLPHALTPFSRACAYAVDLVNEGDKRVDDKWGPAGCIEYAKGKYLFFGWASS